MSLIFARHGESEANVLRIVSNRPGLHPLTAVGREQAEALAQALRGRISRVYASPLLRAMETAGIVCRALGLDLEVVDALREYDCGVLEGRSDADTWAAHARWFRDWIEGRRRDRGPEGGESFEQIRARFVPFVTRLVDEAQRSPGGRRPAPLLVGHGGLYRVMLPLVLDNVGWAFTGEHGLAPADLVTAEVRRGRLVCTQWGGISLPRSPGTPA